MNTKSNPEVIAFRSAEEWEQWLARSHASSGGVWLRLFKQASGKASVTYAEALAAALCYGWIDGQLKKYDAESWLRKFTPRRRQSVWSKRNRELVEQLARAGKMRVSGIKEVEAAKADGRWKRAYDSPSNMTVPADFLKELSKNRRALLFFRTLNKTNTYAISWRLQIAKRPETRKKRMRAIIAMLSRREKFHG